MMSNKTTTLLSDLAAILPGIGLILGWILYPLYLTLTPEREIKIKVYEPIFKKVEFVKIPENQEFLGKPPSDVRPTDYRIVYKEIPILDKNGNPVFKHQEKSSSGKGVAKITEFEVKEILIPILKQPTWTYGDLELKPIVYEDPKTKTFAYPQAFKVDADLSRKY
jgi:hypothetical protein